MSRGSIVRIEVVGLLVGVLVTLVAVLIDWLPTPASEQMDRIEFVFWFATIICIAIFPLVAGWMLYIDRALPGRPGRRQRRAAHPRPHGLEIGWTLVPTLLVTAIAIVSRRRGSRGTRRGTNPLEIDVTRAAVRLELPVPAAGEPEDGQLVLPLGRTVKLNLRANDVIHSFWIPKWAQKQDAVPGIVTPLVITPNRLGRYPLVCTELCGLGIRPCAPACASSAPRSSPPGSRSSKAAAARPRAASTIFASQGCGSCHTFKPTGSTAQSGQTSTTSRADARKDGKAARRCT
jgi:cytochrome c oxidase subunit 2